MPRPHRLAASPSASQPATTKRTMRLQHRRPLLAFHLVSPPHRRRRRPPTAMARSPGQCQTSLAVVHRRRRHRRPLTRRQAVATVPAVPLPPRRTASHSGRAQARHRLAATPLVDSRDSVPHRQLQMRTRSAVERAKTAAKRSQLQRNLPVGVLALLLLHSAIAVAAVLPHPLVRVNPQRTRRRRRRLLLLRPSHSAHPRPRLTRRKMTIPTSHRRDFPLVSHRRRRAVDSALGSHRISPRRAAHSAAAVAVEGLAVSALQRHRLLLNQVTAAAAAAAI